MEPDPDKVIRDFEESLADLKRNPTTFEGGLALLAAEMPLADGDRETVATGYADLAAGEKKLLTEMVWARMALIRTDWRDSAGRSYHQYVAAAGDDLANYITRTLAERERTIAEARDDPSRSTLFRRLLTLIAPPVV